MKWTNRFSSLRVGYAIGIALIFILSNTLMCSLASVLIDKYICIFAINICFLCLFFLLLTRKRLEGQLPEFNYITYGKIALVVLINWAFIIVSTNLALDFFIPFIILPVVSSTVFDDSLSFIFSLYLLVISALAWDYSSYIILCYMTLLAFGGFLIPFFKKSEPIQKLYALILIFTINTLISIVFYYFNYIELTFAVLIYGILSGLSACILTGGLVSLLNRFIERAQVESYEDFLDPDYSLYNEIKQFSSVEFLHASRISRLSRKCAEAINANADLAACAGFYYRLGKIEGEPVIDNAIKIANNHGFPADVIQILSEFGAIVFLPSSKESAIVQMVDSVVTKVELFDSDSMSSSWNQNMVIYQTINELSQKGFYDNSGLSMNQFLIIREILANEDILA